MKSDDDVLTQRELWEKLKISRAQFYRLKADGRFDALEAPIPHRYSLRKVEIFLHGRQNVEARAKVNAHVS